MESISNIKRMIFTCQDYLRSHSLIVESNGFFGFKLPSMGDILFGGKDSIKGDHDISLLDRFLLDIVPKFINDKSANENGTKELFKKYAMEDESNDDAFRLTGQELIERSGFKYKDYDCLADDGYITVITRLINPLADRSKLRWPPVLMMHGGSIDLTAYLIASSIQHHPEPWPRTEKHGPFTSWNRSLAFVLANNGFDVWLAETRGSSDVNTRHVKTKAIENIMEGGNADKNMTVGESIAQILRQWDYWSFTQDDIIAHEIKAQMDLVLRETNSTKLTLFTYSLSTPTSLGFLSTRPDYAENVHGFISMAPIISGEEVNSLVKTVFQGICPCIPDSLGKILFTDGMFTQTFREFLVLLAKPKKFRYSFMKMMSNFMLGPSAQYETLLEINVIGHLMRRLSFRELKQLCQQMNSNRLQKFDYGYMKNKLIYNQTEPPVYDLSNLNLKNWIIIRAENDALSTQAVADHLIEIVHPKPIAQIIAPGFNHIDLFAGVENDRYVNFPILKYLQSVSSIGEQSDYYMESASTTARQLDLRSLFPQEFTESTKIMSKAIGNMTSNFNPTELFENLHNSWTKMIENFNFKKLAEITKYEEFSKYLPKLPINRKDDYGELY